MTILLIIIFVICCVALTLFYFVYINEDKNHYEDDDDNYVNDDEPFRCSGFGNFPHPTKPNAYYYCVGSIFPPVLLYCTENNIFDPTIQTCVYAIK
ncbi:Chitin-binding domain type 2 [Trabala vishnou gigantina nucleopolyhedrovirus]|uniref:Chitin-binding domain type 2 n=1 Tax=Trabala vishnou gigantina nucleopolyhedrovirus TaxID=2863583 RepID=UPI002481A453|nr:Chitin-binding domain type 2 [Trabala vishnou gigantina nucleopolyhedrovirus]QYC92776.1 Chitin-binding domain type 2 [Trabala vishnou gigantina nucleopolyhedrovirus]